MRLLAPISSTVQERNRQQKEGITIPHLKPEKAEKLKKKDVWTMWESNPRPSAFTRSVRSGYQTTRPIAHEKLDRRTLLYKRFTIYHYTSRDPENFERNKSLNENSLPKRHPPDII
jgi:hypothetical protein